MIIVPQKVRIEESMDWNDVAEDATVNDNDNNPTEGAYSNADENNREIMHSNDAAGDTTQQNAHRWRQQLRGGPNIIRRH